MKILHFGDLHVWRQSLDIADPFYPKRWLGYVNLRLRRRKKFPPELGERVMADIAAQDADVVICTGDFSTSSLDAEFERAAELVAPLREKWGERLIMIPGNHDRYSPKSITRYDRWFPSGVIDGIREVELADGSVVVLYDASRPFKIRSNGDLTPELEQRLDACLAKHTGRAVILAGHYPYATLPDHPESWDHQLLGEERLAALVAKHKPAIYLHGHKHVRWAIRAPLTPETICLNCGSAGMQSSSGEKQAGYVSFEWNEGRVGDITRHVALGETLETALLQVIETA